ncbi:Phytanoyl-CoA dioxygenase (PhyH) [Micromonospora viridifaciens]|uniref:Phytanoyl-CoA dioxygenase (PhyH) n=1 Tax=Micromonospora viridifaciens TaxID=1881 RepID=A0A1C4WK36_MICVI|nr:phytanoyl-CoA dioxygenase family protein [Micromonospora viridifaciens]SCE96534.1 Phytanoyl-CoA dioxygenase (PhyH) [Micromonospora viridifaciens]
MTATLTDADVAFFRENGYLLPSRQLLPEDRLSRLELIFNEHLEARGDKLSDELDTPHYHDERLLDYLLSDEVLDWVEPLVGPNIALWSSHFISKDPFTGRATPWHEDSAYWEGRFDDYDNIVTIWLALEGGSFKENGCMRVIPGSHLDGGFSDNYRPTDMTEQTFHAELAGVDEAKAVYFELQRGEFSMHDGRIVHGARANTSATRRTGYTMRYFPSSVKMQDVPQNEGWKIWLARGVDLAGNDYANAAARA